MTNALYEEKNAWILPVMGFVGSGTGLVYCMILGEKEFSFTAFFLIVSLECESLFVLKFCTWLHIKHNSNEAACTLIGFTLAIIHSLVRCQLLRPCCLNMI